ncbi:MAG: CpaF family protein [Deltaproteobacteria bacterium]
MEKERFEMENEILDKLAGKIFLLQDSTSKREAMFQVFLDVYNSPRYQKFIKKSRGLDIESFFNDFLSYGVIEEYLADPQVEDIMINYLDPIYVHKAGTGLLKTEKQFSGREEIELFIKKLVVFSGRKEIKKLNNVELANVKGRVNIAYSPFGPQITITRAKEKALSIIELLKSGGLNPELAALFWLYVEGLGVKPANLFIAGGPGAGKTTLLNALFSFIPTSDRMVVIEDTLELNTNSEENCSRLESDEEVTLADLVKNALRMRPDRVIVGEVRGKEAQDLMTITNIGKYCMGTLHASTARETVMRLTNEPMNVPTALIGLVDVLVIMRRYNINGKIYRVVGELVETSGMEQSTVLLSTLWSYNLANATFHESGVSSLYRDRLAEISGKSPKDILVELKLRMNIIKVLLERNILDINEVTKFCRQYASAPNSAIETLGLTREALLGR